MAPPTGKRRYEGAATTATDRRVGRGFRPAHAMPAAQPRPSDSFSLPRCLCNSPAERRPDAAQSTAMAPQACSGAGNTQHKPPGPTTKVAPNQQHHHKEKRSATIIPPRPSPARSLPPASPPATMAKGSERPWRHGRRDDPRRPHRLSPPPPTPPRAPPHGQTLPPPVQAPPPRLPLPSPSHAMPRAPPSPQASHLTPPRPPPPPPSLAPPHQRPPAAGRPPSPATTKARAPDRAATRSGQGRAGSMAPRPRRRRKARRRRRDPPGPGRPRPPWRPRGRGEGRAAAFTGVSRISGAPLGRRHDGSQRRGVGGGARVGAARVVRVGTT
ncbi:unnamed protein product [Urochloa humidicola]